MDWINSMGSRNCELAPTNPQVTDLAESLVEAIFYPVPDKFLIGVPMSSRLRQNII